MFAHQGFDVVAGVLQCRERGGIFTISQRYGHVAQEARAFDAFDGGIFESGAKIVIGHI